MKVEEARKLKVGQYVDYLGARAMVRGIRKNGIIIDFWGRGLQQDKLIKRRVSAEFLNNL